MANTSVADRRTCFPNNNNNQHGIRSVPFTRGIKRLSWTAVHVCRKQQQNTTNGEWFRCEKADVYFLLKSSEGCSLSEKAFYMDQGPCSAEIVVLPGPDNSAVSSFFCLFTYFIYSQDPEGNPCLTFMTLCSDSPFPIRPTSSCWSGTCPCTVTTQQQYLSNRSCLLSSVECNAVATPLSDGATTLPC